MVTSAAPCSREICGRPRPPRLVEGIASNSGKLGKGTQNKKRILDEVAAPEPAWLGAEPEEPFKATALHPAGGLRYTA